MSRLALITLTTVAISMGVLFSLIKDPKAVAAEQNVHTTLLAMLIGGTAVNIVCATVTRAVHAVPPGDELDACTPYGLMGGGIAARLHMRHVGGYVHGEWAYIKQTPTRVADYAKTKAETARGLVEGELKRLGIMQAAEDLQKSEL